MTNKHKHSCGCNHDHHDHHDHHHSHHACACGGHHHEHAQQGCGCVCNHDHDHSHDHSHEHKHAHHGCGCNHDHDHEHHHHHHHEIEDLPPLTIGKLVSTFDYEDGEVIENLIAHVERLRSTEPVERLDSLIFRSKQFAIKEFVELYEKNFTQQDSFISAHYILGSIFVWSLANDPDRINFDQLLRLIFEGNAEADVKGINDEFLMACEKMRSLFHQEAVVNAETFVISNLWQTFIDMDHESRSDLFNLVAFQSDFSFGAYYAAGFISAMDKEFFAGKKRGDILENIDSLAVMGSIYQQIDETLLAYVVSNKDHIEDILNLNFDIKTAFPEMTIAATALSSLINFEAYSKGQEYPEDIFDYTSVYTFNWD
ncbi:hypothetical protein [Psittacicella hinzii]|uniref:Uncharacterized protein n=1 Tax=Psittacicella hinzii TaxID=2028575 RepID=A0A3A1YAZ4_9GAMM|nr:hypothetical protein [Psittacicella hinzii]RIY34835.1 hypothetical protein CKF58_07595 [Psittacicella hinzii]